MNHYPQISPIRRRRRLAAEARSSAGILLLLVGLISSCGGIRAGAAGPEVSEHHVKAAFLLNFPKYVEWPAEAFATTNSPIVVAVLGDATLASNFEKMSAGKTINGRPVVLKNVTTAADYTNGCHILFISAAARHTADTLLQLQGRSILTVSDEDDFLAQGGAIHFAHRDQKIRLEVNLTAATAAQLKISSKLLSVADLVKGSSK